MLREEQQNCDGTRKQDLLGAAEGAAMEIYLLYLLYYSFTLLFFLTLAYVRKKIVIFLKILKILYGHLVFETLCICISISFI